MDPKVNTRTVDKHVQRLRTMAMQVIWFRRLRHRLSTSLAQRESIMFWTNLGVFILLLVGIMVTEPFHTIFWAMAILLLLYLSHQNYRQGRSDVQREFLSQIPPVLASQTRSVSEMGIEISKIWVELERMQSVLIPFMKVYWRLMMKVNPHSQSKCRTIVETFVRSPFGRSTHPQRYTNSKK